MSPESEGSPGGESGLEPLEEVIESFLACRRRGEKPGVEEFAAAHPALAGRLREILPSLLFVETVAGSDRSPAHPPERLGDFRLVREIGRGGMGVVWEAEQLPLRRRVALKVLPVAAPLDATRLERFRREAEVASRLDHPGICTVYAAGVESGVPYIAMRLVEGETLARQLDREAGVSDFVSPTVRDAASSKGCAPTEAGPPSPPDRDAVAQRAALLEEVARVVHVAHEAGVIHRDLKPGNIMVTPEGRPVILDFGLAHDELGDLATLTRPGDIFGTPAYLAPEQIGAGSGSADRRTDVYALGVTLYECATGRRPFEAPTRDRLYRAILEDEPADPRKINPKIPADLGIVILTALAKERDHRYQTAGDLAEDLRRVRCREPVRARRPGPAARLARWVRRHPRRAVAAAAFAVLLAALGTMGGTWWARLPELDAAREAARRDRVEGHIEEGFHQLGVGTGERAQAAFEAALAESPGEPEAVAGLAFFFLAGNDPDGALLALDRHPIRPAAPQVLRRMRALALREAARPKDAAREEEGLAAPATDLEWFIAGMTRMVHCGAPELSDYPGAVEDFGRAALLAGRKRALYLCQRAHAAGHARDRRTAVETAGALKLFAPESARAAFWRGYALLNAVGPEAALEAFGEALRLKPDDEATLITRGMHFRRQGDPDRAVADLQAAIRAGPEDPVAHYNLGLCIEDRGDLALAAERFREAVRLRPWFAEAWSSLGRVFSLQGDHASGEDACRKAVRLRPKNPGFRQSLAHILEERGSRAAAVAELREVLRLEPQNPRAHCALAAVLFDLGEVEEAGRIVEAGLEVVPDDPAMLAVLARIHGRRGDVELALATFRKSLAARPDDAITHHELACVLMESGRPAEAVPEFEAAARLRKDMVAAWRNLSRAKSALGDVPGAIAAAREAVAHAPRHPLAHFDLGCCLVDGGRPREGLEVLRRAAGLGAGRKDWSEAIVNDRIRRAEALAAVEERLPEILDPKKPPPAPGEALTAAGICRARKLHASEARLLRLALPSDLPAGQPGRRDAARAAVLAGTVAGQETLDEPTRAAWRHQALAWLLAELNSVDAALDSGRGRPETLARALEAWQTEPVFDPVRDPALLAALPEGERTAWLGAWERFAAVHSRLRE